MKPVARWEPDARGRLEKAAIELFQERGYARTTVEEIAARAGLTERTFFRHFADKREVLFSGSSELESDIVERIQRAPRELATLDVVAHALAEAGAALMGRRELSFARARFALVTEHAELHERELIKLASLATAMSSALLARGVVEPAASLAAEAGIAAFKIGFQRWLGEKKPHDFAGHVHAAMDTLRALTQRGGTPNARAGSAARRKP